MTMNHRHPGDDHDDAGDGEARYQEQILEASRGEKPKTPGMPSTPHTAMPLSTFAGGSSSLRF